MTILLCIKGTVITDAQISPGDLSKPHGHLEGLANCTKCHELGNRITGEKCLDCHTEIRERITAGRGYHVSPAVTGKQCIGCHNEHHGKNFRLINMNTEEFDHNLTGFGLSEPHSKLECRECHNQKFITDPKLRDKETTWLGTGRECLNCHADYHLNTLSAHCLDCHSPETFKTAPLFNHDKAAFRLLGKHKQVGCIECHEIEMVNGSRFQEFRGVKFSSCKDCHEDPHSNKFGPDCRKCHTEQSFTVIKGMSSFDHSRTSFPLEGKHLAVDCKSCHKERLTGALKHEKCTDCHTDYHKGELSKKGSVPDCSECHSVKGFGYFTYTLEQHEKVFPLKGAHVAQPCFACHKEKGTVWTFRLSGKECRDCHENIHKSFIAEKYYPGENCTVCHNESNWQKVAFDHSKTGFLLTGAHLEENCASCHIKGKQSGKLQQKFTGLAADCSSCHEDHHAGQFGTTACSECHITDNWKPEKFNHNNTSFKLTGEHAGVACAGCHKPIIKGTTSFTDYKIKDYRCESCHF